MRARLPVAALVLVATLAFGHSGCHDHILTMTAVGFFAYQLGGRALWLILSAFVPARGVGGAMGAIHELVIGAVVASGMKAPTAIVAAVAGLFAVSYITGTRTERKRL